MRSLVRLSIICLSIFVIVISTERFLFSSERAHLFAWWFFSGEGESIHTPIAKRVSVSEIEPFKTEIQSMLESAKHASITQKVALSFATEFADDPQIKEQLIIIAFDHPNTFVKCKLRRQLGLHHEIIITAHSEDRSQSSKFSLSDDCK